jgi:hypothetical protein
MTNSMIPPEFYRTAAGERATVTLTLFGFRAMCEGCDQTHDIPEDADPDQWTAEHAAGCRLSPTRRVVRRRSGR